jgi:hypothetical protein
VSKKGGKEKKKKRASETAKRKISFEMKLHLKQEKEKR